MRRIGPRLPGRALCVLIIGRLRAHKTPGVAAWLAAHRGRVEVFDLPRDAPGSNAGEYLNNDLKGKVNEAGLPQDKYEVRSRIQALDIVGIKDFVRFSVALAAFQPEGCATRGLPP